MVMVSYQLINGMCGNKTFHQLDKQCEEWIQKNRYGWMNWSILSLDPPNGILMDAHELACGRNPQYYPLGFGGHKNNHLHSERMLSA